MKGTDRLLVSEIFASIQGESTHAGRPCVFVRASGCPLRCRWCDTRYAADDGAEGEALTLAAVLQRVASFGLPLVELTGGEPLAQPASLGLLAQLCDAGYEVLLETSGALDIGPVDRRVSIIMDLKCPGSGVAQSNRLENLALLRPRDELKAVLADRDDYDFVRRMISDHALDELGCAILLSPVQGELDPAELASWIVADQLPARLQLQLHKIIWSADARGV